MKYSIAIPFCTVLLLLPVATPHEFALAGASNARFV